jgi:hypothetical protein
MPRAGPARGQAPVQLRADFRPAADSGVDDQAILMDPDDSAVETMVSSREASEERRIGMAMFAERPYPLEKSLRTLGGVRRGGLAPDDVPTVAVIDDHGARGQAAVTDNAWTLTLPSGHQVSRLEYQHSDGQTETLPG